MRRRALLQAAGCSSLGLALAGCLGPTRSTTDRTTDTPGTRPPSTATMVAGDCPAGLVRNDAFYEVIDGPVAGFELSAARDTVPLGGTVAVTLENVTDGERSSGNRRKFDLQRRHDGDWRSVLFREDNHGWTDEAFSHAPGEGFTWSVTIGSSEPTDADVYEFCGTLHTGRYRFVYWGVTGARERTEDFETDYAIAAPFDVVAADSA